MFREAREDLSRSSSGEKHGRMALSWTSHGDKWLCIQRHEGDLSST